MKYYSCKNKTEFLTLLVIAEKNGLTVDSGQRTAQQYADLYWRNYKYFALDGKKVYAFDGRASITYLQHNFVSFEEMAAILCKTAEPQITKKDLADYVCGWLFVNPADPNFSNLDLNNIKAALHNAANCFDCPNDGIEAYVKRRAAKS